MCKAHSKVTHIKQQKYFTYLGSDIDSDGYSYPEMHRRLGIAGSIMAQLDKGYWRQQRLSLHQAQNIHLSCAVGSVIWF